MKIRQAHIFGFGKWIDTTFHFPEQSLTCVFGENESGKTTLQQFIIFMLFGFPPRKRSFYQPKKSSKLGGRLVVSHPIVGEFSIERLDDETICYLPDGTTKDESWLNQQLKGMTEEMYRSIYSFSALDLNDIREMEDDSLGEILFSIGLTGATDIYMIERDIERKVGDLFKPSGRIPVINKQLTLLNRLQHRATKFEKEEAVYEEKKEIFQSIKYDIDQLERELKDLRKTLFTYEKIRHALPTIKNYHDVTEELNTFQQEMGFPENGLSRLGELKNERLPLQSELEILEENERSYKQSYEKLITRLQDEIVREEANKLLKNRNQLIEKNQLIDKKDEKVRQLTGQIKHMLKELNLDLTPEDIKNLSLSFQTEVTWINLNKENELLQLESEQLEEEKYILQRKKEKLQTEQETYQKKLLSEEKLQSLKESLRKDEQDKLILRQEQLRKDKWEKNANQRKKKINTFVYSFIGIAIICLLSSFIMKRPSLYLISGLFFVIGLSYRSLMQRSLHDLERLIVSQERINGSRLTDDQRFNIQQQLKEQDICENELSLIEKSIQELHIDELKWEERNHLYEQKKKKHQKLLTEQITQFPFLSGISISHWLDLYTKLKEVKQKINEQIQLEEQLCKLKKEKQQFERQVINFLNRVNFSYEKINITEALEAWLQEEKDRLKEKHQYEQFIEQAKNKRKQIQRKIDSFDKEIKALFEVAEVDNEEQFYKKANEVERYNYLKKEREKYIKQLNLTFSKEKKKGILQQTSLNENEIELKIQTLNERIKEKDDELHYKREKLAEIEAELKQKESSDQLSEVIHQIEIEREKLLDLIFEWTMLETTMAALERSKKVYQDKYLKEVINKTSLYFAAITNGTYDKVFPPKDNQSFFVQTEDYTRFNVNELSQGTVNQLYVSLRLAISEVMSKRYHVPFIIDDAFVHFDKQRTENVINLLLEIGKRKQIILFTCKDDIRKLMPHSMVQQIERSFIS